MKKVFLGLALVSFLAACNSKKEEDKRDMLYLTDTTNLNSNVSADTALITTAAPVVTTPVRNISPTRPRTTTTKNTTTTSTSNNNDGGSTAGTDNNTSGTTAPAPAQKEGWSKAAKGATIGGVAGAAAGAIIGKNAKGAVIGGVIGAGGGYIIGRKKDKKDGRVN